MFKVFNFGYIMHNKYLFLFFSLIVGFCVNANSGQEIYSISSKVRSAKKNLEKRLISLGNSSFKNAKIIFVPEIHDDPQSLLVQALIASLAKNKRSKFIILEESLDALKQSNWDFFTQKAMEVIAAEKKRRKGEAYSVRRFENTLKKIAINFKRTPGALKYDRRLKLWGHKSFKGLMTPFFGWDKVGKSSLTHRNARMVNALKSTLNKYEKIFVMLGARHVPELEYHTSMDLVCDNNLDFHEYFNYLNKRYGNYPQLKKGVGSTTPIYNFLKNHNYAVVFEKSLYRELDRVMKPLKNRMRRSKGCIQI